MGYVYDDKIKSIVAGFEACMESQLKKYPQAARILAELDAKSSTTYKHSIQVGLQFYARVTRADFGLLSGEEIHNWTLGAILHDAGKIYTTSRVLHSGRLARGDVPEMMAHSIQGIYALKRNPGLPKEVFAAAIGHHLSAKSIDHQFEGAGQSKDTWDATFGEGFVDRLIKSELSWMQDKDKYALKILSFMDCLEAERADYRSYKNAFDWGHEEEPGTVAYCMAKDAERGMLDKTLITSVKDPAFRNQFDTLGAVGIEQKARNIMYQKRLIPKECAVSTQDKMNEILEHPETGLLFFKEAVSISNPNEQVCFIEPKNTTSKEYVRDEVLLLPAEFGMPDLNVTPVILSRAQFFEKYKVLQPVKALRDYKKSSSEEKQDDYEHET